MGRKLESTNTYYYKKKDELRRKAIERYRNSAERAEKLLKREQKQLNKLKLLEELAGKREAIRTETEELKKKSIVKILATTDKRAIKVKDRAKLNRKEFIQYLGAACRICTNCDTRVLDFDHINPEDKIYNISDILWWADKERIKKEIDKCQLLCANCHRIKTLENNDYMRGRLATT